MPTTSSAVFVTRPHCIACRSTAVRVLDSGAFSAEPLRTFIEQDPWGISPLPFLGDQVWEYVRCDACGQAYQKRLLTPEWQEIRFRDWMSGEAIRKFEHSIGAHTPAAHLAKATAFSKHVLRIEKLTREIRGSAPVRVLDFGCGWGEFLVLAKAFGFDACGVERSPDRVASLRSKEVTVFPDLSAAGVGFHAATLFQVLEHLDDPLEVLQGINHVLLPGGTLILEVPNCTGVEGIRSKADYYAIHPLEHVNCFTPASLTAFALRAGFERVTPTAAHVTTSIAAVAKGVAAQYLKRTTTNQYFR